jgi:hypothetical protein
LLKEKNLFFSSRKNYRYLFALYIDKCVYYFVLWNIDKDIKMFFSKGSAEEYFNTHNLKKLYIICPFTIALEQENFEIDNLTFTL